MSDSKLKVIVVGSGLAGLAAAVMLREHHSVAVYERGDPDVATSGQGICLFPNGVKILQTAGFDPARAGGVPCHGYRSFDKRGELLEDFPIDFKARWGADMFMMKRSDFRRELLRLATTSSTDDGIKGDPANIYFNRHVVGLDPESAIISFQDGSTAQGDVLIVADGIRSRLRHLITGDDSRGPKKTGLTLFRIAMSAKNVEKAIGHLPKWWAAETDDNRLNILQADDGTHRLLAHYPLQHHNYRNFSCLLPMVHDRGDVVESWYADGNKDEMLQHFGDFNQEIHTALSAATEVKFHDLQDLEPLSHWNRGRTIVIGDAAHAMTPLQGQGAGMAVEDADSLQLLRPGMSHEQIKLVLEKIDSIRRPRAMKLLQDTRDQAKNATMEERLAKMDYNCSYNGIFEALNDSDLA